MQIVAHIGHTIEMYHIIHAVIDYLDYIRAESGWQTTIEFMHLLMFREPLHHVVRSAQIRAFIWQYWVGLIVKISHYLISEIGNTRKLLV